MDLGPHALDLMLQIGGPVAKVSAWTGNLRFSYPVEDFCQARLEFARGGNMEAASVVGLILSVLAIVVALLARRLGLQDRSGVA